MDTSLLKYTSMLLIVLTPTQHSLNPLLENPISRLTESTLHAFLMQKKRLLPTYASLSASAWKIQPSMMACCTILSVSK